MDEQVRAHAFGLERRIGRKIAADHDVMTLMVMHAGTTITRTLVGTAGMTAYERLYGKKSKGEEYEFGESVLYRLDHKDRGQLGGRWEDGV